MVVPMACLRCGERKIALQSAVQVAVRGNGAEVVKQVTFVTRTLAEDATRLARQGMSAARASLARGLKR